MKKENVRLKKVAGGYRVESTGDGVKLYSKDSDKNTAVIRANKPGGGYKDILSVTEGK